MTLENKTWDSLKTEYLRQVAKALSSVKHSRSKDIIEDVRSHLDRRFAELEPQQQTWENFQTIITEMGPASDYAELLDPDAAPPKRHVRRKYLLWISLVVIIVTAAILLPMAISPKVGYIVTFKPVPPFEPQTAKELLSAFNENHPPNIRTHHFRTRIRGNILEGLIYVDAEAGRDAIVNMIDKSEKLNLAGVKAVTQRELEKHYLLGQPPLKNQGKERRAKEVVSLRVDKIRAKGWWWTEPRYKKTIYENSDLEIEWQVDNNIANEVRCFDVGVLPLDEGMTRHGKHLWLQANIEGTVRRTPYGKKWADPKLDIRVGPKNLKAGEYRVYVAAFSELTRRSRNWKIAEKLIGVGMAKLVVKTIDRNKLAAEDLAGRGWQLWRERKLGEAEEAFKEAVQKDPTNADAWNGLGWSQFNQGKTLNAKVSFEKCLEIQPNHAAALNGLGWIAKGQGKTDEAIGYWEKAVKAAPNATAALSGLATTYIELEHYDKAIKVYQKWVKVEPNNDQVKADLERARSRRPAVELGDLPRLIAELSNPNAPRFEALNRIIKLGSAAVPILIKEMKTNNNWQIPKALGAIGDRRAILPLIEKLEKSDWSPMREVVSEALERITDESFGNSKGKWRKWWQEKQQEQKESGKSSSPSQRP